MAHTTIVLLRGYANSCNSVKDLACSAHRLRTSALTNRFRVPLDLSSHSKISAGPSAAIMRAQGSARCRLQTSSTYFRLRTVVSYAHCPKDLSANDNYRWSMGSVLFLAAWGVLMGPIQYGKQASFSLWLHTSPTVPTADASRSPAPHFWSEASVHGCLFW